MRKSEKRGTKSVQAGDYGGRSDASVRNAEVWESTGARFIKWWDGGFRIPLSFR
uniref:Uncharacterized protein n=1 Tax=Anguilla anguilla TaxID=7936 RepID=A0A0E9RMS3_ANGAN